MLSRFPWALLVLLAAFFVPATTSRFYTFLANDMAIWALFATSLNLLVGYTGLVSFGHAAYFGIGAYATGLVMKKAGVSFLIAFPAAGVVARKSSDILAIAHQGVAKSLRYIWEHGHEPIRIVDLLGVAAMSRRGLHKAFLEHVGRTPGLELQRVRIDRAKKLLTESSLKVEVIARTCGYQSINSFCVAFKRVTGMSAKVFRENARR